MRVKWNRHAVTSRQRGFTLLELIITIAIIGIAARFVLPGMAEWRGQRDFDNMLGNIERDIITARQVAETQHTTARLFTVRAGDTYTITTLVSTDDPPAVDCDANGNWDVVFTRTVEVHERFEITGDGIGHVCFYRDGTASGGTYNVAQKDGGDEYGSAVIQVTIATGTPDVQVGG